MSSLQIGRITTGPPIQWFEQVGDPVTNLGGAVIPSPRLALRHSVATDTLAADGATDTLAARLILRRQLRAMLNNTPLKLQGYIYVQYSDDPEQNGWYVPDQGQFADGDGSSGLATGWWKLENIVWLLVGHRRVNREARNIWMRDLRGGLNYRDQLRLLYSTDFAALPAVQLSVLPSGTLSIANTLTQQVVVPISLLTGRDGGTCQLCAGLSDLATISFERSEASYNLSDVITYDRRGLAGLPETNNTNFVPNPSFEHDTAGNAPAAWITSGVGALNTGAAITATAAQAQFGTQSMQVVTTNAFANEGAAIFCPGTLTAGVAYSFSIYLRGNAGGESVQFGVADSVDGDFQQSGATVLTNGWQRFSLTYTPATTHTHVYVFVRTSGASAATWFTDSPLLVQGPLQAYFDGDTSSYHWAGTAGNAASSIDPQTFGWLEVTGPDWPWNWLTAGQPADTPVLDNGLVRVRYDASAGKPGLRVDVWAGSSYVEQGKACFYRLGDVNGRLDTWVSASLVEYTPERVVLLCVLAAAADVNSRERIYVTLQRGELGAVFEYYPAPKAAGTLADGAIIWTPALNSGVADLNQSGLKIDSLGTGNWVPGIPPAGKYVATAGTGVGTGNAGLFSGSFTTLGAGNFSASENWVSVLRCPTTFNIIGPYQATLVVLQAANNYVQYLNDNTAYGTAADTWFVWSQNAAGYNQVQVNFAPTQAQQIMEAEAMTLGTNTVAAVDAAASGTGSNTTTSTRTTDANPHVSQTTWPNGFLATYRVFARVKTTASTLNIYAKTGATTGTTQTTTSASYVWIDLGEIVANNTTLEIHCWATAAATVSVDRVEAVLVQDRARTAAIYSGARDQGQAALYDSRQLGAVVAR